MNLTIKMKMKLLLLALAALAAISTAFSQNRPSVYVDTLANLDARTPIANETVHVRGASTVGDWGNVVLPYVYNATATNAVDRFSRAPISGVGRYIHRWDGDASAFGVSTNLSDNGALINTANAVAISKGIPLTIPEGQFKVSTWINLISGSHIRGKGMGKTVILRNSASDAQTNNLIYATIQTPGVFNPYTTNGGHGADVIPSVSKIVLEDLAVSEAPGSYSGFAIALFAAEDSTIQRVYVYGVTNHWAITLHGNRLKAVDNRIDNTGNIYQDGIHLIGGQDCIISRNVIRSGDDSIAISTPWMVDPHIRNILVSDNSLYSSHGHVLRMTQENGNATNLFEGIRFVNNSGTGGFYRNGILRFNSSSSNATLTLRDISVSKSAFQMGSFTDHSSDVNQGGFGIYAEDCQGLKFENVTVGPTIFESFRFISCDDIELNNCTAVGATYSGFFNNTIRVENTRKFTVNGGDIRNVAGYGAQMISLANVTSVDINNAFLSNSVVAGGTVGTFSNSTATAVGRIQMFGNTINSRSYALLCSVYDPVEFEFIDNKYTAPLNTIAAFVAANRPVPAPARTVDTLAALVALPPDIFKPFVVVQGRAAAYDWGNGRLWKYEPASAVATNEFNLATSTGTGRWTHTWDGDGRTLGVIGDTGADMYSVFTNAIAVSVAQQRTLKIRGTIRVSNTLILSDRVDIEGEIGDSSTVTPGTAIVMTGTNLPILEVRGGRKLGLRNVSVRYLNVQDASQTSSTALYFPSGYQSYMFKFDNVALANGAYGISGSGAVYNGAFRDIWIQDCSRSFIAMEGGGTTVTWDNIYCQNVGVGALATTWRDSATISNVVRANGTNLTFTCSTDLPMLLQTNAYVYITGLAPAAYNGLMVVTAFDTTTDTFTASLNSDPGTDPSDVSGTIQFTPKPIEETPVRFHYGQNTISGLDIEHVFIGASGFAAVAFRGELSSVKDLHLEQVYFTNALTSGQPVHYIRHSGKATKIDAMTMFNFGIVPGRTNAVVGTLAYVGTASAPIIGPISFRDIGMTGASLIPFVEYTGGNPDPIFELWVPGGTARAFGTPFIEQSLGRSPLSYASNLRDGGSYLTAVRLNLTNSIAVITNGAGVDTNFVGMSAFSVDLKNVGARGGNTVLSQFLSDGTNRFYIDGNGRFFVRGQGQQVSEIGKSGLTTSAITMTHDAATDRRMMITGNGIQVVSNSVPSALQAMGLQTTYGGNLIVGIGTAGDGILLGGSGPRWISGTGSPEGVHTAVIGSLYSRTDGGAGTSLYVKESGTGNTGWIAK